jgi:DNA polymerase (family 10)
MKAFARLAIVVRVRAETPSRLSADTDRGTVTLYLTTPEQAGAALVWYTGSRAHVAQLEARARGMGLTFTGGTITRTSGPAIITESEDQLYKALDLPFIPPELRDGDGEIAAAERGQLPRLVSEGDIRGDLHVHTTWSDGRHSIADMVSAARQLGYEYIAITDHSERAWSSRRLSVADVPRQRAEIEALRAQLRGIEILHGVEVDIMQDGSLDFDDELLVGFDIVLASLHDSGGHDAARLTERYLGAIRHPLVNVITHPANRAPGRSSGYDLDFDPIFAAAAETGTAMEVDGAPGHLDMDGATARRAAAAGVTITIDSDCHRADALARQMQFGVATARRGWIEPAQVLNSRPVADVREFVARKRSRG